MSRLAMTGVPIARALRRAFRRPRIVLELALLAALLSASVIVMMAVGSAQVLISDGSEALPMIYLLLAAVSLPLASGISAALCRWPVARIGSGLSLASLSLALALRLALAINLPGASATICIAAYAQEIIFDTLFWLLVSEHLPTLELKRHTPFLAAAFGLGGVGAGFVATAFCEIFAGEDLLLLNAGFFALCVLQFRRIATRFPLVDQDMADEAEPGIIESFKATFGVTRAFPITSGIALGVMLMAALFCFQDYLAMTAYQAAFTDADELSSFMAIVYAAHQAAELIILAFCGRLILERAGPLLRNLIFPLSTLLGLVILSGFWTLPAAIFVQMNVVALSNAVFEPVKTLNLAAIPHRALAQVRMLIDGVLYPLGVSLAALGLLWLQGCTGPQGIVTVSFFVAVAFIGVSVAVGAWFLPDLIRGLRLRSVPPEDYARMGKETVFSTLDIRRLLDHPDPEAQRFGANLAERLAPELLVTVIPCGDGAATSKDAPAPGSRGAVTGKAALQKPPVAKSVRLRAEDFAAVGEQPPVTEARTPRGTSLSKKQRVAAGSWRLSLIARAPWAKRIEEVGWGLEDESRAVRRATAGLLARFGAPALPTAAARLASDRPEVVEAAIEAIGGIGTRRAERILRDHLRPLYRRAQLNLDEIEALAEIDEEPCCPRQALRALLNDSNRRIVRRTLAVKSALGNARDIKLLHALTTARETRTRSDAVEALLNMPTRRFIQPLVPLLEASTILPATVSAARPQLPNIRPDGHRVRRTAATPLTVETAAANGRWAQLLVARLLGENEPPNSPADDQVMLDLILFLKTTPLFCAIALEDIARIAKIAESLSCREGEPLTAAGDAVSHIFIIRNGSIELLVDGTPVEKLGSGAAIGEAALFGNGQHPFSSRAAENASLLRFQLSRVSDLVAENPEALAPLALDLTRRLNTMLVKQAAADRRSAEA